MAGGSDDAFEPGPSHNREGLGFSIEDELEGESDEELDEERFQEIVEDLFLGFMDGDEYPSEVWDEFYMSETRNVIEDELGLEHPEFVSFLEYPNGQQMLYDAMTQLLDFSGIYGELEELREEREGQESQGWTKWTKFPFRLGKRAVKLPKSLGVYLWFRKKMEFQGERVMGIHEVNKYTGTGFPSTLDEKLVGWVPENIEYFAERQDISRELAEQYVKTHEGIHVVQSQNFPWVQERREELIQLGFEDEADPEEIKDEMQSLMMVLEGHAEFFTNKIAEERYGLDIDRSVSLKDEVLYRFYRLKEKREQYSKGSDLIEALYDIGGVELAHEPLRDLPSSVDDIESPENWA